MVTVLRTNHHPDPRATAVGSPWGYQLGSGETASTTLVTDASDGPLLPDGSRIGTYIRRTVTGLKTGGTSGPWCRVPNGTYTLVPGDQVSPTMYVRFSVEVTVSVQSSTRSGSGIISTSIETVTIPANTWTRVGQMVTATAAADNTQVWATLPAGTILPVGTTVDATGGQSEKGVLTPYFDGSLADGPLLPNGSRLIYDWTGAANASASTESLTDAVISAELITSAGSPPPVQVVLNGIPNGAEYVVTGSTGSGSSWPVPGGTGVGDGGQIVLVDNRSALNTPVTYSVVVQGVTYSADPVVVEHPDENAVVLQSLDARVSAAPTLLADSNFPLAPAMRVATFNIPRRAAPVTRWDRMTLGGTKFTVLCTPEQSRDLQNVLSSGAPIVIRSASQVRDLPAVQIAQVTSATSPQSYPDGGRKWELDLLYVDDPEPSRVLSAWTWADFNEAALVSFPTWADFNALFAGQTWADFDTTDWGQYQ